MTHSNALPRPTNQQAIAALRTKNWRAALAACNACLASNPDNLKARARRADAHKCLGELDEAQADLSHIVGLKVRVASCGVWRRVCPVRRPPACMHH